MVRKGKRNSFCLQKRILMSHFPRQRFMNAINEDTMHQASISGISFIITIIRGQTPVG